MPNCFQLISKKTGEPENFSSIDEKLCAMFDVPVDDNRYLCSWYDIVGLNLATGRDFDEQRKMHWIAEDESLMQIIDFLDENYTSNSWYEHR